MALIINYGWEIDERNGDGDMPLHVAIRETRPWNYKAFADVISTLISIDKSPEGVVVNALNSRSQSPLMLAVVGRESTEDLVKLILADERLNVNYQGKSGSALFLSVVRGWHAVTECLLDHAEINPNLGCKDGLTPLQAAILTGDVESASLLLKNSAIRVTAEDWHVLVSLQEASDDDFLPILKKIIGGVRVFYLYRSIELHGSVRDDIKEIRTIIEARDVETAEMGELEHTTSEDDTTNQQQAEAPCPPINFLPLLLYRGNNSWWTLEELERRQNFTAEDTSFTLITTASETASRGRWRTLLDKKSGTKAEPTSSLSKLNVGFHGKS